LAGDAEAVWVFMIVFEEKTQSEAANFGGKLKENSPSSPSSKLLGDFIGSTFRRLFGPWKSAPVDGGYVRLGNAELENVVFELRRKAGPVEGQPIMVPPVAHGVFIHKRHVHGEMVT
jgi:hypothetical protein